MIRLPDTSLPITVQAKLTEFQQELDALADYAARVASAKQRFGAQNRKGDPTFDAVKLTLTQMCSGARRCGYCEDSAADEVEHIRPKSLYPEFTFAWANYLYACGPCNGPKNNHFAVFAEDTGALTHVSRRRGAPIVPPPPGPPVLIDPRVENPTEYMTLDLRDTFYFVPRAKPGTREHERAKYTLDILQLNKRDLLPQARRAAYRDYIAHLSRYIQLRDQGSNQELRQQLIREIQTRQHPTVWLEMKRQHALVPELKALFTAAPEALAW